MLSLWSVKKTKCIIQSSKKEEFKPIRFVVPGPPRGYTTTNRYSRPSAALIRYHKYCKHVRECAKAAGLRLPLFADKDNQLIIKTIAFFENGVHPDPLNVNKGVGDALFYKEDRSSKNSRKGNDKQTGGVYTPPKYDKKNPRCVVIIKEYTSKDEV